MVAASRLPINQNASALNMAQEIFGDGVQVVGASYSGDNRSSGIYTDGDAVSPGVTPGDSGVILSTGRARDFTNTFGQANQDTNTSSNTQGVNNDPALNAIAGTRTYDASILDVDFIPTGDVMTMQFVFSSEEYPEYANSIYNDVVGVWINGTHVPLEVAAGSTSVGNVNNSTNENLYIDNTSDQYNTEMDGFTVTMTLTIPVTAGVVNSLRIGIADVGDSSYDSNLLIAGGSVQTALIANSDVDNIFVNGSKTLDVLANDDNSTGGALTITHINNVVVTAGDSVTLTTGQVVTLNADGTITVDADADIETFNFTYKAESTTGTSDTAFVTLETIPCFVAGTMILTPEGEVPVETLQAGDLVETHDDGAQPIRWIGQRIVEAKGDFAPVMIEREALGLHRRLLVSPQHRVLICDSVAELLFGDAEVLIKAKDLVNGTTIRQLEGGRVEYVHLLFDDHQVVFSEGLATESFLPGPQTTRLFEREIVDEICAIFPEIDPDTGAGYSPAARRTLRSYEAQVLTNDGAAA